MLTTMITTFLSHILAALYLQKQKYNKLVTACFWGAYAIFATCVMLFFKNVEYGFFALLFVHFIIFFITTTGSFGEKFFLFFTYSNSFCVCIGANIILSFFLGNTILMTVCKIAMVILMHLFLYKILLPRYRKSRIFFSTGWRKLNVILVLFFMQFLKQYAFEIERSNHFDMVLDFVLFSSIFYLTLVLSFNLVQYSAEVNKKAFENNELKSIAYTDALTNMKNRLAYKKFTRKQVLKHRNNADESFIFVLLDVNGFKNINDTYGHVAGDEILKHTSTLIVEFFEIYNCECFRFGGDEFVLIIKDIQLSFIEDIVAKMNEKLLDLHNITLSYGCSKVDFTDQTPFDSAFKTADAIMYSNKEKYYSNLNN